MSANRVAFLGLAATGMGATVACYCRAVAASDFSRITTNHQLTLSHMMALDCNRVLGVGVIMPIFALLVGLYSRQFPLKANVQQGCRLAWIAIPGSERRLRAMPNSAPAGCARKLTRPTVPPPRRAVFFFDVISRPTQHLLFVSLLLGAAWKWKADLRPAQARYARASAALMLGSTLLPILHVPMLVQACVVSTQGSHAARLRARPLEPSDRVVCIAGLPCGVGVAPHLGDDDLQRLMVWCMFSVHAFTLGSGPVGCCAAHGLCMRLVL